MLLVKDSTQAPSTHPAITANLPSLATNTFENIKQMIWVPFFLNREQLRVVDSVELRLPIRLLEIRLVHIRAASRCGLFDLRYQLIRHGILQAYHSVPVFWVGGPWCEDLQLQDGVPPCSKNRVMDIVGWSKRAHGAD